MKYNKTRKRSAQRRGTAAVEFAFAAPALLLIIFLSCEFARMSMLRNLAQDAAYEACRFGMVEGATDEEAEAKAQSVMDMLAADGVEVVINDGLGITSNSQVIKVDVSIDMQDNAFVIPWLFTGKFINATMELRMERYKGFYDANDN